MDGEEQLLRQLLVELEPPCGVLRVRVETEAEIEAARGAVRDGLVLLKRGLPAAAAELGEGTLGRSFQALLAASASSAGAAGEVMYAQREDRAAGAQLPLEQLGHERCATLAARVAALVALLRIKLEDDGDLAQAAKTLRDCANFFDRAQAHGAGEGLAETLEKLRR